MNRPLSRDTNMTPTILWPENLFNQPACFPTAGWRPSRAKAVHGNWPIPVLTRFNTAQQRIHICNCKSTKQLFHVTFSYVNIPCWNLSNHSLEGAVTYCLISLYRIIHGVTVSSAIPTALSGTSSEMLMMSRRLCDKRNIHCPDTEVITLGSPSKNLR